MIDPDLQFKSVFGPLFSQLGKTGIIYQVIQSVVAIFEVPSGMLNHKIQNCVTHPLILICGNT